MRRAIALGVATACMTALMVVQAAAPVAAYPSSNVVLAGHGFGHGRGMGQYGALGYALRGAPYTDILQHFYSNTTPGTIANDPITVQLTKFDGHDGIVQQEKGHLVITNGGGQQLAVNQGAALVRRTGANLFTVYVASNCGGAPSGWQQLATNQAGPIILSPAAPPSDDHTEMLQACQPDGQNRWYRGNLLAAEGDNAQHLVNSTPIESYLRGVVPRESPASWGDLGGGAGMNALKAQAVAARSYSFAENRHSGWVPATKTCDTTSCQVYGGNALFDGSFHALEDARSDQAVQATAGQVRNLNNAVARTEFSSSTGGFTAGGTFPAVVDDGDDVCVNAAACNNNHNWTANVPVSAIQGAYPQVGGLQSVTVVARTREDGNRRAKTVRITGGSGSVDVAATTFQAQFGLKSTWFDVTNSPSGGVQGYWLVGSDGGIFTFGGARFFG